MPVLFGVASVVAVAGMLWGSVAPARACICAQRSVQEYLRDAEIVVMGELVSWHLDMNDAVVHADDLATGNISIGQRYPVRATIGAERYFVGSGPTHLSVASDGGCNAFEFADVGDELVLFLVEEDNWLVTNSCAGSGRADFAASADEVEIVTGPGTPPQHEGLLPASSNTEFPYVAVAAAAVLGPLAFLAGAAFLSRRGEPHNG